MRTFTKGPAPDIVADHDRQWQSECRDRPPVPGETPRVRARFDQLDKKTPRERLVAEQLGLCAFCLGRIRPQSPVEANAGAVLAHVTPLSAAPLRIFDWTNLVGACPGGTDRAPHCDRAQADRRLHIHPGYSPLALEEHITYSSMGRLHYGGPALFGRTPDEIQAEFDDVLRLNVPRLMQNRTGILEETNRRLPKSRGPYPVSLLHDEIRHWESPVSIATDPPMMGRRPYFCVAIAYLKKKLRAAGA